MLLIKFKVFSVSYHVISSPVLRPNSARRMGLELGHVSCLVGSVGWCPRAPGTTCCPSPALPVLHLYPHPKRQLHQVTYLCTGWISFMLLLLFSCWVVSNSLQAHGLQHARPPCPSPTPRAYSNSCPLSQWCHPTILSSVVPFSSHLQSFPASGDFLVSQLFESGGQSIGASISCMSSTQLGRNMFCIMFEWKPSVWEEIKLYRQWTATLENRVVLCNWTCLSLVLI